MSSKQKNFLEKHKAKLDGFLDSGGTVGDEAFFAFMRAELDAYDAAIEADERAMTRDEFVSKWSEERMKTQDAIDPSASTASAREASSRYEGVVWAIKYMLDDFNYVIADDQATFDGDRVDEFCDWLNDQADLTKGDSTVVAGVKIDLVSRVQRKFLSLFGRAAKR